MSVFPDEAEQVTEVFLSDAEYLQVMNVCGALTTAARVINVCLLFIAAAAGAGRT